MLNLSVKSGPEGQGVVTAESLDARSVVLQFFGRLSSDPTKYSVQVGADRHLEPGIDGNNVGQYIWRFINHHCEANCRIDFENLTLVTDAPIQAGEQITINYNASESELAEPFDCQCNSENCLGNITGYFGLTDQQKVDIRTIAAPYLLGETVDKEQEYVEIT